MAQVNTTPIYNLKVVIQETGIKPDTLRAWERRYGLPRPERTSGGHRLYSQRDIEIIKWLVAQQEEGLTISRAVQLWRKLTGEGVDPLQPAAEPVAEPAAAQGASGASLSELRQAWVGACLRFDEAAAERIVTQAFALYRPETVCLEVLQKGLVRIGELWYAGEATVQEEHFASALVMRRLSALLAAAPPPVRAGRLLVGCPAGEEHTFAPLLLTMMLRYRGWDVLYLGANVPLARLETTIHTVKPRLVILAAQQLRSAAALKAAADFLGKQQVRVAFGGQIFDRLPALRGRIYGHYLGERLDRAIPVIEQVLSLALPVPAAEPISDTARLALEHYRRQQGRIEARLLQLLPPAGLQGEQLTANLHQALDIGAALSLGEINLLRPEVAWLEKLMLNYEEPVALLSQYLQAHHQAALELLDQEGRPVIEWLGQAGAGDSAAGTVL